LGKVPQFFLGWIAELRAQAGRWHKSHLRQRYFHVASEWYSLVTSFLLITFSFLHNKIPAAFVAASN
jgi:hypothetical protein